MHHRRFGTHIRRARGGQSRLQFCRRLGLSYTFVRAIEQGKRLPSDRRVLEIAAKLALDPDLLVLHAHCDRSAALCRVLERLGWIDRETSDRPSKANGKAAAARAAKRARRFVKPDPVPARRRQRL